MVASLSNLRVLVAEDENLSRRLLVNALESWGYSVAVACNGEEAWEQLSAPDAPPLVLLDWMMPGIDGLEICRRLRADAARPYCYVIMLTAQDSTADLVQALDAGADDFIAKPFRPEELRVRLRAGQRIVTLQQELHHRGSYDQLTGPPQPPDLHRVVPACHHARRPVRNPSSGWRSSTSIISSGSTMSTGIRPVTQS